VRFSLAECGRRERPCHRSWLKPGDLQFQRRHARAQFEQFALAAAARSAVTARVTAVLRRGVAHHESTPSTMARRMVLRLERIIRFPHSSREAGQAEQPEFLRVVKAEGRDEKHEPQRGIITKNTARTRRVSSTRAGSRSLHFVRPQESAICDEHTEQANPAHLAPRIEHRRRAHDARGVLVLADGRLDPLVEPAGAGAANTVALLSTAQRFDWQPAAENNVRRCATCVLGARALAGPVRVAPAPCSHSPPFRRGVQVARRARRAWPPREAGIATGAGATLTGPANSAAPSTAGGAAAHRLFSAAGSNQTAAPVLNNATVFAARRRVARRRVETTIGQHQDARGIMRAAAVLDAWGKMRWMACSVCSVAYSGLLWAHNNVETATRSCAGNSARAGRCSS